ncbi:MAG: T9SS type A sorting domain-containing protein, partial [Bacteroidota bacterium]
RGDRMVVELGEEAGLVQVRILDTTGREVNRTVWVADGVMQREMVFESPLPAGIYVVELVSDGVRTTERMIVQK